MILTIDEKFCLKYGSDWRFLPNDTDADWGIFRHSILAGTIAFTWRTPDEYSCAHARYPGESEQSNDSSALMEIAEVFMNEQATLLLAESQRNEVVARSITVEIRLPDWWGVNTSMSVNPTRRIELSTMVHCPTRYLFHFVIEGDSAFVQQSEEVLDTLCAMSGPGLPTIDESIEGG